MPFPVTPRWPTYADATCAQSFQDYVGISYLDSSLFFTYLIPSARGWDRKRDRTVICFVTTTGAELTARRRSHGVTGSGRRCAWVSRARCPGR